LFVCQHWAWASWLTVKCGAFMELWSSRICPAPQPWISRGVLHGEDNIGHPWRYAEELPIRGSCDRRAKRTLRVSFFITVTIFYLQYKKETYTPWTIKTCHLIVLHNFDKWWPIFNFLPLDSRVNLPRGSRHISQHTCNVSLYYTTLWKHNIKNSKILTFPTQHHRFTVVDKSNQINLIVCVLLSHIKCQNVLLWRGCMHGNICDTRQVHDVDELKQRLTKVWHMA